MMTKFTILLIFLLASCAFAQVDSTVLYYDNGNIKSDIHYKHGVRDGDAIFYRENGNKKEELTYVNGKVEGLVRIYDDKNTLREMFTIENGKREGPTTLFDSTGKYIEDVYYEEGILAVDKIVLDDGAYEKLLASYERNKLKREQQRKKTKVDPNNPLPPTIEEEHNYEDDPAFYISVEVLPKPIGGMKSIYKKLSYPKEAIENEIEGIVVIRAFIDRDGEVLNAEVVEGIGYGCDEAARLAVFYHRFKPGLQRGQRIKVQMDLPIEFKLEEED